MRKYKDNELKQIEFLTIKDWTNLLTRDNVTHQTLDGVTEVTLRPLTVEIRHSDVNWPATWERARVPGLPSDLASMLFKVLHNLLPTQERQYRLGGGADQGNCTYCDPEVKDDLLHAFTGCTLNKHNFAYISALINYLSPGTNDRQVIFLGYQPLGKQQELAACMTISEGLRFIWHNRTRSRALPNQYLKAEIIARANILKLTARYKDTAAILLEMIKNVPP